METLERWLRERPLVISLLLAALLCWAFGADGIVSEDVMPVGDAEHYVLRGMTLYGYLHSGQWSRFWDVFTLPRQSLAPLHYWLFFLLPQSWASMTSYGATQAVATYGLLAIGLWNLCRALDRVEWTPALFLFCGAQNISLDYSFFYYTDVPFLAMGSVALAWQILAWRVPTWQSSLLSGLGASLMFWVKAPNAILFTATYLLAELIRSAWVWRATKVEARTAFRRDLARHAGAIATGYFPVTLLALACGGFQSIVKLVDENEVSGLFVTNLECTGLLRFLYFPLCLTFFYHTIMLVVIFGLVGVVVLRMNYSKTAPASSPPPPGPAFPASFFLPLLAAYFVLGEIFSFGMANKEMRSLLLVLPIFWLAFFWALECCRVRAGLLFLAAASYVVCALSQVLFNGFETVSVNSDGYQLKDDWLSRLPQSHPASLAEINLTEAILGVIHNVMPEGGKVAVGTEQLYVTSESLSWCLEHDLALHGQLTPYEFSNFITVRGEICRSSLLEARGMLLFVQPSLQYSQGVFDVTKSLLKFIGDDWYKKGIANIAPLQNDQIGMIGFLVVMKDPLTNDEISQLIQATNGTELPLNIEFSPPVDRRLTWRESMDILRRWEEKRLGWATGGG